jgi:hypothetical protein
MRHASIITFVVLALSAQLHAGEPVTVGAPLTKAYIPIGFDSKNVAQVVVEGEFTNTCYKVGSAHADVDAVGRVITINQDAYYYPGFLCLQVMVPFSQVVNIGVLGEGDYSIVDGATGQTMGVLPVAKGVGPGPDDYLYAPVGDAYIESRTEPARKHTLIVRGSYFDRCTRLTEIRVREYKDVITVQPITERIGAGENCGTSPVRFLYTQELNPFLKGDYLLHVRSLNGQALNKLVYLP